MCAGHVAPRLALASRLHTGKRSDQLQGERAVIVNTCTQLLATASLSLSTPSLDTCSWSFG